MALLTARPHPVATFLVLLVFGPYLLAAAALIVVFYALAAFFLFLMTVGRQS